MNFRSFFLFAAVLVATPLFAREKTDVVVMKNGDRLTCEIKSLESGTLSIGLDYATGTNGELGASSNISKASGAISAGTSQRTAPGTIIPRQVTPPTTMAPVPD